MRNYFVYMMSNMHHTLYVGVTNDLYRRMYQHRNGVISGFTKRYGLRMLVWYEQTGDIREALAREKEIKAWRREKKIGLIESMNPEWKDLSREWLEEGENGFLPSLREVSECKSRGVKLVISRDP